MGLTESDADDHEAVRASLEHLVPKAKGALFVDVVSRVADECCWEESPHCTGCPLAADCPTGQEHARETAATGSRSSRLKPR